MNIALIIAGGVGNRARQEIPKQFLTVNEKPILIYTLEVFQRRQDIDHILVVSLEGWQAVVKAYCRQFGISKLLDVAIGGATRFQSMYNGVKLLQKQKLDSDSIILVHDGNRPLIDDVIIDDVIAVCHQYGNAVSALKSVNSMYISIDGKTSQKIADRNILYRGLAPEALSLNALIQLCDCAHGKKMDGTICELLISFGKQVHLSLGSERSFKITTPEDIDMFKALITFEPTKAVN